MVKKKGYTFAILLKFKFVKFIEFTLSVYRDLSSLATTVFQKKRNLASKLPLVLVLHNS